MAIMTPAEYVAADGTRCPFCGSHDISGQSVEIYAGGAAQEIDCAACNRSWIDNYVLTGYTPND